MWHTQKFKKAAWFGVDVSISDFPKIESVIPLADFKLWVTFASGVEKIYDCRPLLTEPSFALLRSPALFRAVQVDPGGYGISWNDELDLSETELWRGGVSALAERHLSHETNKAT
jgi:hypothetical protein